MNIGMDLAILKNFPLRRQGQGLSFLGKKSSSPYAFRQGKAGLFGIVAVGGN